MLSALKRDWISARHLTDQESQALLQEFIQHCVEHDYVEMFKRELFGSGVGHRCFKQATAVDEKQSIYEHLGVEKGTLFSINVMYQEPWENPGYRVQGRLQAFKRIVLRDEDWLMKISCGKIKRFYYHESAREVLFWTGESRGNLGTQY